VRNPFRRQVSSDPEYPSGVVRVDARTKKLTKRLQAGEIAVINHTDLDRVAAEALAERGAGDADLRLQPTPDGILRLVLAIPGDAGAGEAYAIVEAVVGAAEANPYLRSHLDVVEIVPVSANSQSIP